MRIRPQAPASAGRTGNSAGLSVRRRGPGMGERGRTKHSGPPGKPGALLYMGASGGEGNPAVSLCQRSGKHPVVRNGHSSPRFRDPAPSDRARLGRAGSRRISVRRRGERRRGADAAKGTQGDGKPPALWRRRALVAGDAFLHGNHPPSAAGRNARPDGNDAAGRSAPCVRHRRAL